MNERLHDAFDSAKEDFIMESIPLGPLHEFAKVFPLEFEASTSLSTLSHLNTEFLVLATVVTH